MAIYHCSISNISRGKGSSSIATASYITGIRMCDERTGERCDYGRKERVLEYAVMLPEGAPDAYKDPERLCNAIEKYEKAENARPGKKIEVALPRELDLDTQREIVKSFSEGLNEKGYACIYAIHNDKENNNPHAHILVINRQINERGEWNAKRKMEYALDEHGERIPRLDPETGLQKVDAHGRKQWVRVNAERNPLDSKETLQQIRKNWEICCNMYLDKNHQIDCRSYEEQGIEREPMIHEGYAAREIETRGDISERCEQNREIREHNALLEMIRNALRDLQERVRELFEKKAKEDRTKEEKINQERSESERQRETYRIAKQYAEMDLRRSYYDRLTDPIKIKFGFDNRRKECIEEKKKMLHAKIFDGVPLPERYQEIEKELRSYDRFEQSVRAMIEDIRSNMERGVTTDELLFRSATDARIEAAERFDNPELHKEMPEHDEWEHEL